MGLPVCVSTALIPSPDASIWIMNGVVKSSIARVGVVVIAVFSSPNNVFAAVFHSNLPFSIDWLVVHWVDFTLVDFHSFP